jgi:pyruvate formate lyase activating enzyme
MGNAKKTGTVLRIERASIHDGQGLRTVVFLKGCPMRCAWCSTPESQTMGIEVFGAASCGTEMSTEVVMREVDKDRIFFFHSGGGVTISGGEPFMQAEFTTNILRDCKTAGINTVVESCLYAPFPLIEQSLPWLDFLYADLKFVDSARHKQYCGQDNALILENYSNIRRSGWKGTLVIRIPLVPGITDRDEDLLKAAEFCESLGAISVEFLQYHRLGVSTYEKLHREYSLREVKTPSGEYCMERKRYFAGHATSINVL